MLFCLEMLNILMASITKSIICIIHYCSHCLFYLVPIKHLVITIWTRTFYSLTNVKYDRLLLAMSNQTDNASLKYL